MDYEQFEKFATMTTTPHVMIIPSDFKQFIKVVVLSQTGKFSEVLSLIPSFEI